MEVFGPFSKKRETNTGCVLFLLLMTKWLNNNLKCYAKWGSKLALYEDRERVTAEE